MPFIPESYNTNCACNIELYAVLPYMFFTNAYAVECILFYF